MSVFSKDLWIEVKELLLEQYRGNLRTEIESQTYFDREDETTKNFVLPEGADNRLQSVLKLSIDKLLQPLDNASVFLQNALSIEEASGNWLDLIGSIAGVKRSYGESDQSYKDKIKNEVVLNKGIPDAVIFSSALLSQDPAPQYMDEAPATFFVYTGPVPSTQPILTENGDEILTEGGGAIDTDAVEWDHGGSQLSHSQVRNLAPAGVLGLPGAALNVADQNEESLLLVLDTEDEWGGKLLIFVADDSTIEREVLLADNNGAIVIVPNSVPVRVVLRGPSVPSIPTITTEWNGVPVDAVRIKDLPAAGDTNGYFVRDSDTEGTVKSRAMDEATLDDLWNSTPAEGEV